MRKRKTTRPENTEKAWLAQVRYLAKTLGWQFWHPWLTIYSARGWPDVALVRPPRLIFAELKTEKGKVSPEQQEWLDLLRSVGGNVEVYVWRASDFDEVVRILR